MKQEFADKAAFYVVYIQEAHASDVWQMDANIRQQVVFASPKNYEERNGIADSCVRKLNIQIPAVIDTFDNATERAYTAWPDRLFVINREGQVAYKSRPGPFGFHPDEAQSVLTALVGSPSPATSAAAP
jgi:type I thyroxine 5'-deiodinase